MINQGIHFSESVDNANPKNKVTTRKSLWIIRQNEKKPISRQRHPHIHFREIDRLMYPLKSPHPSPHHLSPIFNEAFRSNLTSLNIKQYDKRGKNGSDYMNNYENIDTDKEGKLETVTFQPKLPDSISKEKLQDALTDLLVPQNVI